MKVGCGPTVVGGVGGVHFIIRVCRQAAVHRALVVPAVQVVICLILRILRRKHDRRSLLFSVRYFELARRTSDACTRTSRVSRRGGVRQPTAPLKRWSCASVLRPPFLRSLRGAWYSVWSTPVCLCVSLSLSLSLSLSPSRGKMRGRTTKRTTKGTPTHPRMVQPPWFVCVCVCVCVIAWRNKCRVRWAWLHARSYVHVCTIQTPRTPSLLDDDDLKASR